MSVEELLAFHDRERRVRRRVSADDLVLRANAYQKAAYAWLQEARRSRISQRDRALAEALRIAEDDGSFISLKIQNALESKLRREEREVRLFHDDPQELADVAVALIDRSVQAWRTIAGATEQETPASLARQLADLRALLKAEFPDASDSPGLEAAVQPRLETSVRSVESIEARISAMEKKIDRLARGMVRFQKQVLVQPRRKR